VNWKSVRCPVFRKYCRKCNVAFTLLIVDVLAYWQYPRPFVVAWLWSALHGTSCRDRTFLVSQGVPVPVRDPAMSWSDQQDCDSIRPCHQLLARWGRTFGTRAARLIPALTAMCVLLGVDLKNTAEAISGLTVLPRLSALPVALGLMQAFRQSLVPDQTISLEDCLPELVMCLARRSLPPSHGVLRASGHRLLYDSLVT
jgi:hypothetical protein